MIGRIYELVSEKLPVDIDGLQTEALGERHRFVEQLVADWISNKIRFDQPGQLLLAARVNGVLAAIGGFTTDPATPGSLRINCFYVRPAFRRIGIGYQLAAALFARVEANERIVVNAIPESISFWEAIGFKPSAPDERILYYELIDTASSVRHRRGSRRNRGSPSTRNKERRNKGQSGGGRH